MIAVLTGRRRYWDAGSNVIIVSVTSRDEILAPMFVFRYEVAFSDLLDVRWFVFGICLNWHELFISTGSTNILTACKKWFR